MLPSISCFAGIEYALFQIIKDCPLFGTSGFAGQSMFYLP